MNTNKDIKDFFLAHKVLIKRLEEKRQKYLQELILDFNPNITSYLKEINHRLEILYADINSL